MTTLRASPVCDLCPGNKAVDDGIAIPCSEAN